MRCLAGNAPMVEKSVEQLNRLNEQAVKQIPDLPRDGKVEIKAKVTGDGEKETIEILEKNVITFGPDNKVGQSGDKAAETIADPQTKEETIIYRTGNHVPSNDSNEAKQ